MLKITRLHVASFAVLVAGWFVARLEQKKNIEEAVEKYMDELGSQADTSDDK